MNQTPQPVTLDTGKSILPGAVYNGKRLKPFSKKDVLSRSRINELVAVLNCFLNPQVRRGDSDQIVESDGGWMVQILGGGSSSTSTGGNMHYVYVPSGVTVPGIYDSTKNYNVYDVVYTNPDSNTRMSWVCEIVNGPSSSVQAPTWPEPGTVYWRALARFFFNSATTQAYRAGFDGDVDAIAIDSITGDVICAGQFSRMSLVDSVGNSTSALRNAAAELTTYLSSKAQHWYSPSNPSASYSGTGCVYNSSGQPLIVGLGDFSNDSKWNDVHVGSLNGFAVRFNTDGSVDGNFAPPNSAFTSSPLLGVGGQVCTLDGFGNLVFVCGAAATKAVKLQASNGAVIAGFAIAAPTFNPYCIIPSGGNFWIGDGNSTTGECVRPIDGSTGATLGGFTSANFAFTGGSPGIYCILLVIGGGGSIFVCGQFDSYGGTTRTSICKLSSSGTLDTTFNPSITGGLVYSMTYQSGKLVIGGTFNSVNGNTRYNLARIDSTTGATDTGWNCAAGGRVLCLQTNGRNEIVVGGSFTTIGGAGPVGTKSRNRIARVDSLGNVLGI